MRYLRLALLYTALILGANTAWADFSDVENLREGTLRKLIFSAEPSATTDAAFMDEEGNEFHFSDYEGKVVLVNFWATWCAPCRKEMLALDALSAEFGGDDFEVVTIATGRNTLSGIKGFFMDQGIENLPILLDTKSKVARDMAVLGLPVTVILDRNGAEIARLRGDAEWFSDSAQNIVKVLIDPAS
ncbi:MAG: TlpA disulfide reductase family protein [Paracoccaceae bacterium]|nr:TlpA disulfide reductase family protein [Paracoccaceae bacterium]